MSALMPSETRHAFDAARIMTWASFSGDYNPIHLDREAARRVGADDVVVHGMVPMMLAIQAAEHHAAPLASSWRHCRVRLKRPVIRDEATLLSLKPMANGSRFEVCSAADRSCHMAGTLVSGQAPVPREVQAGDRIFRLESFQLRRETAVERVTALESVFPEVSSLWLRLSAVLFSEFLKTHLPALQDVTLAWARESGFSAREALVLQTSYAVSANQRAFGGRAQDLTSYDCTFEPAAVFRLGGSYVGDCWLRAYDDEGCVMEIGVGLLLRLAHSID